MKHIKEKKMTITLWNVGLNYDLGHLEHVAKRLKIGETEAVSGTAHLIRLSESLCNLIVRDRGVVGRIED